MTTDHDPEELELFDRLRATGDEDARAELVERYRGLALYHARRFVNRGIEQDDLEQVAMLGLLKSVDRFDPTNGAKLATFASRTMEGELKRYFRDRGWAVRVPRPVRDLSVAAHRAAEELQAQLNRPPKPAEIAERLEVDVESVIDALDARVAYRTASLDQPRPGEDRAEDAALRTTDRGFAAVDNRVLVEELLEQLPERSRTIVKLRYVDGLTQAEIGAHIGVSQMQVSRLLRRTLLDLRKKVASDEALAEGGLL